MMDEEKKALLRRELISNAGTQLGRVTNESMKSIKDQESEANDVISSIYALNESVDLIHNSTSKIQEASVSLADQGEKSVQEIQEANQRMQEFKRCFAPIYNAIDVINDIADNTKLLAVNATIQAAKAGLAGKSFAVVAKEIQNLSDSTQKSSVDIRENINELKTAMHVMSETLGSTVGSLDQMKEDALRNKELVASMLNDSVVLNQKMDQTHAGSIKIRSQSGEMTKMFSEVDTINQTFEAILALMDVQGTLTGRHDAMAPFEAIAESSEFFDGDRFSKNEEEYVLEENDILISSTDLKGVITYGNSTFYRVAQFEKSEMVGKPHNIIRHPDMPKSAFKHMWNTIQNGDLWQGIVLNRGNEGRVYWVRATIFPVYKRKEISGYLSVRAKPSSEEISRAKAAYRKLP